MNAVSIVSSLIIIVGCFMPWLQLGALFANRGIDNPDGAIMLVAGIISGAVALNNSTKNQEKNKWVFVAVGILGIVVGLLDLNEVHERANKVAQGMTELSEYIGERKNVSTTNFIGSGLYIVAAGSIGLLLCGLGLFSAKTNTPMQVTTPTTEEKPTEIVAPKFAKVEIEEVEVPKENLVKTKTPEEIENEQYKEKLVQLNSLIETQKKKMFGGGMNDEIRHLLSELATNKREGIHLLNSYKSLFKRELIYDLSKLNSSYAAIRDNVDLFVQLDIVNDIFPHDRK